MGEVILRQKSKYSITPPPVPHSGEDRTQIEKDATTAITKPQFQGS